MAESRIKEIPSDADFLVSLQQAKANETKVVVDFTASWCGPCKAIAPVFKSLSTKYPNLEFWKVDGDKCKVIIQGLGIKGFPTFHYYCGDTLVIQTSGADEKELEKNVKNLNDKTKEELLSSSESKKDNFIEGDLVVFQDEKRSECLNDSQEFPFNNLFVDNDKLCKSDADEQLLLTIGYVQLVRIKSIRITSNANGPKTVKIFVNSPNLEFDSAEDKTPTQILNLKPDDLKEGAAPITLDIMKFASVDSVTIFVVNNQTNNDTTEISRIVLNGTKS